MPRIVTIGVGGDYTSINSWVSSSDFSTDWGAGNPAIGMITGRLTAAGSFFNVPPNGAILTAFPGEEFDGTNFSTCAGIDTSGSALQLRSFGTNVENLSFKNTANSLVIRLGWFDNTDASLTNVGVRADSFGDAAAGIEAYPGYEYGGSLSNIIIYRSGGHGLSIKGTTSGTFDRITVIDSNMHGDDDRNCFVNSGGSDVILTNCMGILSDKSIAEDPALAFVGFSAASSNNASNDNSAPGSESVYGIDKSVLMDYAGGDYRTDPDGILGTAGSGGSFIGGFVGESSGPSSFECNMEVTLSDVVSSYSAVIGNDILGNVNTTLEPVVSTSVAIFGREIFGSASVKLIDTVLAGTMGTGVYTSTMSVTLEDTTLNGQIDDNIYEHYPWDIALRSVLTLDDIDIRAQFSLEDINIRGKL